MTTRKITTLLISSQVIQGSELLQLLNQYEDIEFLVAYCSLPDQNLKGDLEALNKKVFDLPCLENYPWTLAKNYSPFPSFHRPWGLINLGLISLINQYECCIVYGHFYVSFWLAIITAKLLRKPLILSTDATYLSPINHRETWKIQIKRHFLPWLYNRVADAVLVPSTASKNFLTSLGVINERIFITPYVVNNDVIAATATATNIKAVRRNWGIPEDAIIIVFCGKFIDRKRPTDLISAFAEANIPNTYLVLVGDGPLRSSLEAQVKNLHIENQVRFLGFVQYSILPEVYASSNLLVHPADWEPYGLPVNEAMVCGLPAVVSDQVGSGYDLVEQGITGFVYPSRSVESLTLILREILPDADRLKQMGKAAKSRINTWSMRENIQGTIQAIRWVTHNTYHSKSWD